MKKTIAITLAFAAATTAGVGTASASSAEQEWEKSSAVGREFVATPAVTCDILNKHVLGSAGLQPKQADWSQLKAAFTSKAFVGGMANHLKGKVPGDKVLSGPDYDKLMAAVTDYTIALTAQRLNNECHSFKADYAKEADAWVKATNDSGIALSKSLFGAPAETPKKDMPKKDEPKKDMPKDEPKKDMPKEDPKKDAGSSFFDLFNGFSSFSA